MTHAPEPPSRPVSARATVPTDMIYTGQLPVEPPDTPPSKLSETAWRNVAAALATILVLSIGGVVIFWPKDNGTRAPAAQIGQSATATVAPTPTVTAVPTPGSVATHAGSGPSGAAMPTGDIAGWRQTFSEDFNGGDLGSRWFTYEGQPGGDPGGWFLPSHVAQSNGRLVITGSKEQTPNGNIYATGGVSNSKVFSQTYGRFEFRFRMDKGYGVNFVMLLWPSNNVWPPEINVAEDEGKNRTFLSATLHYGADNQTITRKTNGLGDFSKWHTVSVEWKPSALTYKLDGKVWATMSSPSVPKIPMSMAIQTQAWPCGGSFSDCPNSTTPAKVNLEVDWVVAYASA
jgi:beta-glucanase (GH16 family)